MVRRYRRYRRRPIRRRGSRFRRYGKRRVRRRSNYSNQSRIFKVKRTFQLGGITSYTDGPRTASWVFQLDQVPGFQQFVDVFDQYRLAGVKLTFIPTQSATVNSTSTLLRLIYAVDTNDNGVVGSEGQLLSYAGARQLVLQRPKSIFFRPKVAMQVFQSTVTTAYAQAPSKIWLDAQRYQIPHYSFKWWVPVATSGQPGAFVYATYYLQFRKMRLRGLTAYNPTIPESGALNQPTAEETDVYPDFEENL